MVRAAAFALIGLMATTGVAAQDWPFAVAAGQAQGGQFEEAVATLEAAIKTNPKHRLKLTVQRLKFLGHFLESMSKLGALGYYTPGDTQLALLEGAAQHLVLTVKKLEDLRAFQKLDQLRTEDHQLYLDIVGDSAHAVRGLELAIGRGTLGG